MMPSANTDVDDMCVSAARLTKSPASAESAIYSAPGGFMLVSCDGAAVSPRLLRPASQTKMSSQAGRLTDRRETEGRH